MVKVGVKAKAAASSSVKAKPIRKRKVGVLRRILERAEAHAKETAPVSARVLRGMDKAVENFKAGKRSVPADLKKYAAFAK